MKLNLYDALQHPEQIIETMKDADIILVGVSRTSKTPTSIYLANKGLRVGNIPLVSNTPLPQEIFTFSKSLAVVPVKILLLTFATTSIIKIRKII